MKHTTALLLTFTAGCMSSASSTTTEPNDTPTASSSADAGTNDGILTLHDSSTAWEDTDGGLVMVPEDSGTDAGNELRDAGEIGGDSATDAGNDAGHDAAAPPLGKTCDTCTTNTDCETGYVCQYVVGDGASACFLRANSLPVGVYCGDLEPAGHLGTGCYGPCNANPAVCRADPTCTAWKAEYAGMTDY